MDDQLTLRQDQIDKIMRLAEAMEVPPRWAVDEALQLLADREQAKKQ
jgi:hypothetical protein